MILHQQILHPKSGPHLPWFALHVETLTLALCSKRGNSLKIQLITQESSAPISSTDSAIPTPEIEFIIWQDLRRQGFPAIIAKPISSSKIHNPQSPIPTPPPYLLVNSLDGTTPGILHTGNPTALYLARQDTSILQPAEHFRSSVDLTVEGWTYWWEDAQRAFLKLTIEFAQACGTAVPEHIAEQARHL